MCNIPGITAIIFVIIGTFYLHESHASWDTGGFYFTQKTITSVRLAQKSLSEILSSSVEDRLHLCNYAKVHAGLSYLDHSYIPEWKKYPHENDDGNAMHYGMYCATLPTTFLLVRSYKPYIQITFIESKVTDYVFDNSILDVSSVRPSDEGYLAIPFTQLSEEDRRNLCVAAQEYINMVFMDYNVEKGKVYEFSYGKASQSHFAFVCSATPQVYIVCPDPSSVQKLKLIRHQRPVDLYEFTVDELKASSVTDESEGIHSSLASPTNSLAQLDDGDRLIVCAAARKFASLPFKDTHVAKAEWYTFQYPDLPKQRDLSILCPVVPSVHLRLDNSTGETRIKLTFLRNPFEEYQYSLEFYWSIWPRLIGQEYNKEEFDRMIGEFPLTALNEEERWQICSTAVARFASFFVSLIPEYILPKMVKFDQLNEYKGEFTPSTEVALKCSHRPEMYLRVNKSAEKNIKVVFTKKQYDALSNPAGFE